MITNAPKTLKEATAIIADLTARIAELEKPAAAEGVPIPLEAALVLLEGWANAKRLTRSNGSIIGEEAAYHVRTNGEGGIILSVEPPPSVVMDLLERKRQAERKLAQAIADRRASKSQISAIEQAAAVTKSTPEEQDADGFRGAQAVLKAAKLASEEATEELDLVNEELGRRRTMEIPLPDDLRGLIVRYVEG